MSLALTNKGPILKDRALMLKKARDFFESRNILEIDCGALVKCAPIDSNIDVIGVDQDQGFLHTSPEYALKRLISAGFGDLYFLGHVYRKGEIGHLHNPEFTMVEWYRLGMSFEQMIEETGEFLSLFFGNLPVTTISYREAFERYIGINYSQISLSDLHMMTNPSWDRDTCLHYLLTHKVEPELGKNGLTALVHYPPHEAALACVVEIKGEKVAERFEIYYKGVELANGYHELSDAKELKDRFERANLERVKANKDPYLLDEKFLSALKSLPPCCGVALGFDRALMLRHKAKSLREVIPFSWEEM